MQKLTPGFTHNKEWLRVNPTTFCHAFVQKFAGNNGYFILESRTTFERVLCSVSVIACCQQTTLAINMFKT